jgi:uncharacterized DUF497 family protein
LRQPAGQFLRSIAVFASWRHWLRYFPFCAALPNQQFGAAGPRVDRRAARNPLIRRDYNEERIRAFVPMAGRLYVIVYVLRDGKMRVISLRKANNREMKIYDET